MVAPRHLARARAERFAAKLGGAPHATSPAWRLKLKITYRNGGFANCYVSLVDRRITAVLRVDRPGAKARIRYAFTESDAIYSSLVDVAMAVLADDDDVAWEAAGQPAAVSA
jgi:hypothetical protein